MKGNGVNVKETASQLHWKRKNKLKSRGLHKAFNKDGIPLPVMSSKSPE